MKVKRPKKVRWCHPQMGFEKAHRVQTGDSFVSLASQYGFSDPWDIIRFNYGTKDPEEVNWYLRELVGCTKSKDGMNYSFDSSDKFGTVYIPPRGWKPGQAADDIYGFTEPKDLVWNRLHFRKCPYVQPEKIANIFNDKIFLVGDMNLKVWAEYDYGNIIYMKLPKNPRPSNRAGTYDTHWFFKEVMHLAYGAHGMNMAYSLRTEAVALVGSMVLAGRETGHPKLPFQGYRFPGVSESEFFGIIDTFLAQYKKSPSTANLEPLVRLVQRDSSMTRRLQGHWAASKAA
jgi:hypothetical protein